MSKVFYKTENDEYVKCTEDEAEEVLMSIEEYHGYEKALRMVHDRALQQVKKSETDEHGYCFKSARKKFYKTLNRELWLVTKTTPYSCQIDGETALTLITNDLKSYYNLLIQKRFRFTVPSRYNEVEHEKEYNQKMSMKFFQSNLEQFKEDDENSTLYSTKLLYNRTVTLNEFLDWRHDDDDDLINHVKSSEMGTLGVKIICDYLKKLYDKWGRELIIDIVGLTMTGQGTYEVTYYATSPI